ncbi:MAG TPA: putative Ig domain-containing protein [Tepidisphaeraceae bacterium]
MRKTMLISGSKRVLTMAAAAVATVLAGTDRAGAQTTTPASAPSTQPTVISVTEILTPPPPATPRINGPTIFGVRPGSPFLYTIPATGDRPMTFAVDGLPDGLQLDPATGRITGSLKEAGETKVTLKATNAKGTNQKSFRIVVGETVALTPPMGWNSWNSWAHNVTAENVLDSAKIIASSGLINHGWTYVNIDDTWQGKREGRDKSLLANEKFPDMKGLCDTIHNLGLKAGIYSTPWMTSYASYPGGSADNEAGTWDRQRQRGRAGQKIGPHRFDTADANQWAEWGFDYLKYDWNPNDIPATELMSKALRATGRDIVYSLSNSAPFQNREGLAQHSDAWRTTGDIWDYWERQPGRDHHVAVATIIDAHERWAPMSGPGNWNDPDMLVVGTVSVGSRMHPSRLTANEQYAHISMWCMYAAPLLIGCDLTKLDPFTLNLLTNDEVLAVNQDALGKQATRVATVGDVHVYVKPLEDGSKAVCLLNRGTVEASAEFTELAAHGMTGKQQVRDLWRQKDLDVVDGTLKATVKPHGVVMVKLTAAK